MENVPLAIKMVRQARACFSQVFRLAVYSGHVAQSIRAMFAVGLFYALECIFRGDKSGTRANTVRRFLLPP